ncbi:hypothetical protein Hanom_Chr05g00401411 [Helianthus anomalus]
MHPSQVKIITTLWHPSLWIWGACSQPKVEPYLASLARDPFLQQTPFSPSS